MSAVESGAGAEKVVPGRIDDTHSARIATTIRKMSGQIVLGPMIVDSFTLIADIKSKVAVDKTTWTGNDVQLGT